MATSSFNTEFILTNKVAKEFCKQMDSNLPQKKIISNIRMASKEESRELRKQLIRNFSLSDK